MYIESLELNNFRNYRSLSIELDKGTNILYGDNAQGKTNILEAIYIAGTTKSHKGSKDREILDWYEGKTSKGKVADCLRRMADHSGNEMAQRSILRATVLSESDKMYVYLNRVISENSVENETERVEAARSVDIGIDAYFTIRNKYSLLKDQGGKVKNNWISWMRNEGYSRRQIYVMGEAFGWNMD